MKKTAIFLILLIIISVFAYKQRSMGKVLIDRTAMLQLLKDPNLLMQVNIVPYRGEDGKISAYKITRITPDSFFEKIGLQEGDLVASFNEQPITSLSSKHSSLDSLQNASIGILRDGKSRTLKVEIK